MEDSTEKSKELPGENDVVAHCPKSSPQEDSSTVGSSPPATPCPSTDQSVSLSIFPMAKLQIFLGQR